MLDPNDIIIRLARIEEIVNLRWTILRAGLPRESAYFEGDDEPTTHHFAVFVASDEAALACTTFLRRPINDEPAWQLRGMAVREDLRGHNIGARLLDFAIAFVMEQNHSNLLWCNARVPAARFYQRMGWQIESDPFDIPTAGPHVRMIRLGSASAFKPEAPTVR